MVFLTIKGVISPAVDPTINLNGAWKKNRKELLNTWSGQALDRGVTADSEKLEHDPRGRPVRTPRVGEVVLVEGEGRRGCWPLARVKALISGRDGTPRAAIVSLKDRRTRKPVTKLYRLEASPDLRHQVPRVPLQNHVIRRLVAFHPVKGLVRVEYSSMCANRTHSPKRRTVGRALQKFCEPRRH